MIENPFETYADEYDSWFDRCASLYESELLALHAVLPPRTGPWVEIGVGSGRFASRLGIDLGIEPSHAMAALARTRGVTVLEGAAEAVPLPDESVQAAFLITTICFLDDLAPAFSEAWRILRPEGHAVVAFIPRDSRFGRMYEENRDEDRFFARAHLRSSEEALAALDRAGLRVDRIMQTLTGDSAATLDRIEPPSPGCDSGSFVVVRAVKRARQNPAGLDPAGRDPNAP